MGYERICKCLILLLVTALLWMSGCSSEEEGTISTESTLANSTAPIPGNNGTLAYDGFTLSWTAATDESTDTALLNYRVVKSSALSNLDTVSEVAAISGADLIMDWSANIGSSVMTGFSGAATYYYRVAVKDSEGKISLYEPLLDSSRNGMIVFLPLDGDANDQSGNGLHGSVSLAGLASDRYSDASGSYDFAYQSGANIEIPASSLYTWNSTGFSASLWTYFNSGSQGGTIFAQFDWPNHAFGLAHLIGAPNRIRFELGDSEVVSPDPAVGQTFEETYSIGGWTHWAIVFDPTVPEIILYHNGLLVETAAVSLLGADSTTFPIYVGNHDAAAPALDGRTDSVRIYNRTLTATDVFNIYNLEN